MSDERMIVDVCNRADDWTVLGNDTTGLNVASYGASNSNTIRFNKADGAANTKIAAIYRTIAIDMSTCWPDDRLVWGCYCGDTTNVASSFVRLGTDSGNYAEYQFADSSLNNAAWTVCSEKLGEPASIVGNGLITTKPTYLVIGMNFDAAGNTLANIGASMIYVASAIWTN